MFTISENIVIFIIELFQKFGILKTYLYICKCGTETTKNTLYIYY